MEILKNNASSNFKTNVILFLIKGIFHVKAYSIGKFLKIIFSKHIRPSQAYA
jgi:hypothetical protein